MAKQGSETHFSKVQFLKHNWSMLKILSYSSFFQSYKWILLSLHSCQICPLIAVNVASLNFNLVMVVQGLNYLICNSCSNPVFSGLPIPFKDKGAVHFFHECTSFSEISLKSHDFLHARRKATQPDQES